MIYRLNDIPTKISVRFFVDIDKLIPQLMYKAKESEAKTILKIKKKVRGHILLDFSAYYKAAQLKTIIMVKGWIDTLISGSD